MNKYVDMIVQAESAKQKINASEKISKEELAAIHFLAKSNPSNANMTAFAVGQRHLQEDEQKEE